MENKIYNTVKYQGNYPKELIDIIDTIKKN
jgi:hypothetical protein